MSDCPCRGSNTGLLSVHLRDQRMPRYAVPSCAAYDVPRCIGSRRSQGGLAVVKVRTTMVMLSERIAGLCGCADSCLRGAPHINVRQAWFGVEPYFGQGATLTPWRAGMMPAHGATEHSSVRRGRFNVFVSHAGAQKEFALWVRSHVRICGYRAFVDERDLR